MKRFFVLTATALLLTGSIAFANGEKKQCKKCDKKECTQKTCPKGKCTKKC